MLHQRRQSFSAAYATDPERIRSPSIFAPHQVRGLSVFILENLPPAGSVLAGFKDFPWREVYLAHDVEEGLLIANVAEFDVAMLDASVGGTDTSEVALAINKRGLPIVICASGSPQRNQIGLKKATILQTPSPGEKLRAALQIADPNRQH
jgi:hypothetical protein